MNIGTVEAVRADRFAENGGFDYVALGHIHRPQSLGSETVRYAGSLLSYSLDECRGGTGASYRSPASATAPTRCSAHSASTCSSTARWSGRKSNPFTRFPR